MDKNKKVFIACLVIIFVGFFGSMSFLSYNLYIRGIEVEALKAENEKLSSMIGSNELKMKNLQFDIEYENKLTELIIAKKKNERLTDSK